MILAIDFDGTIHDVDHPVKGRKMGPPMYGVVSRINMLKEAGHTIIVHTTRDEPGRGAASDWCKFYGIPFDEITNVKPKADLYIDDKAIRHLNWPTTFEEINARLEKNERT